MGEDLAMKTIYQQGETPEVRMKLKEYGDGLEAVTIIYRNENDLPKLEKVATEWQKEWQEPGKDKNTKQ